MNELHWLVLLAAMSGAFGRIVKIYPRLPKGLLPWLVLGAGLALSFGIGIYNGNSSKQAFDMAWEGLVAGLLAIGGHNALRPMFVWVAGDDHADAVLGRLMAKGGK